jgi:hypothetical protein
LIVGFDFLTLKWSIIVIKGDSRGEKGRKDQKWSERCEGMRIEDFRGRLGTI